MVRKAYTCHVCEREFKQMAPVNDLIEVECPRCHQNFCEELSNENLSQTTSPREARTQQPSSNPPSGPGSP
jgi:DNA-directed RNA polymerase subunit RPC12/RpoP